MKNYLSVKQLVSPVLVCMLAACSSQSNIEQAFQPNVDLDTALNTYKVSQGQVNCDDYRQKVTDCDALAAELAALHLRYPSHRRIMLATAVMYYEVSKIQDSQVLLDKLLGQNRPAPEAAILRAQIAMSQGSVKTARKVLLKQLDMVPDHANLYEALSATYYLEGRYKKAQDVLYNANKLGAASWRISYHLGLINEGQKQYSQACHYYRQALQSNPDHSAATGRLLNLSIQPSCGPV
ncbi:tetratricopeptide repeat protein [Pseudoalteromonas sp.]|uniref:tetratricopeptide repeat protein n=1 Tax=Pseudoalteromonas sp. TaxID=53249 RepID=UPI0035683443